MVILNGNPYGNARNLSKKVRIYIAHEFSVFRNNFSVLRNIFLMRKTWKNLKTFCPTGKPAESCRLRFKHRRGITCQGIAVWQKGKMALGRARGMLLAWGIGTFFCDTRTHHFCKAELRHHTKDIWHLEVRIFFFYIWLQDYNSFLILFGSYKPWERCHTKGKHAQHQFVEQTWILIQDRLERNWITSSSTACLVHIALIRLRLSNELLLFFALRMNSTANRWFLFWFNVRTFERAFPNLKGRNRCMAESPPLHQRW